jgi:hypothetical protein
MPKPLAGTLYVFSLKIIEMKVLIVMIKNYEIIIIITTTTTHTKTTTGL